MSPEEEAPKTEAEPEPVPSPTPKKSAARPKAAAKGEAKPKAKEEPPTEAEKEEEEETEETPRAPRRPTLDGKTTRLLAVRQAGDEQRPRFVRQQFYRYPTLERRGSWRRPRGLQSKQRRHYGYRSAVVRVGYRSPAAVRGRTPTGFIPVVVHNARDLAEVDVKTEAAVLARTIGTRKRLVLEETARQRGVKILNPVVKDEHEE
jgi:large subunit ribosomal protein L32e